MMKKILLIIFSVLIFIIGLNNARALSEGEDVYPLDLSSEKNLNIGSFDYMASECLKYYYNLNDDYLGYLTDDADNTYYHVRYNSTELYEISSRKNGDSSGIYRKVNATIDNNFEVDLSTIPDSNCELKYYDYNKIAVYFDSDKEIPSVKEYTLDIVGKSQEELFGPQFEKYHNFNILSVLFMYQEDDITPEFPEDDDPEFPFIIKKNGKDFMKYDFDEDTYLPSITLINEEDLTTDDNITLNIADMMSFFEGVNASGFPLAFFSQFEKINIIVSHNEPQEEEEEKETVIPKKEEKKEDKKKTEPNPQSGDNIGLYLILTLVSGWTIYLYNKKTIKE